MAALAPQPDPSNHLPLDNGEEEDEDEGKSPPIEKEDVDKVPPIEVLPNPLPSPPPDDDNLELNIDELKSGARNLGIHASRHPDKPGQPAFRQKETGKKSSAERATTTLMQEQLKSHH
ncbi:hypothetical protein B0H17DRAFT_1148142 [Mycena rosella]|uniref:Uncharacterized protein n=1 Tax=Mycena rosella TaxID=1033263 RepID=A0AAD7CDH8_MYCRO|nr:hypothetical protein B0H17DRAFT_1148142 [Mycena rosella]